METSKIPPELCCTDQPTIINSLLVLNMSMLGVMTGAVNVEEGFSRLRREVHSGVNNTELSPDAKMISPLEVFKSRHRSIKALNLFSPLNASCRKMFYDKVADYYIEKGDNTLEYLSAAESVARPLGLAIANCNHRAVHQSIRNLVLARRSWCT